MDIHFGCTQCGNCCKNLKLPLTVAEAVIWLQGGRQVQIICEASPSPAADCDDPATAHFKRRAFATMSDSMPTQVAVILAASLDGSCPNLLPDMRCGIYEQRPLVCRIYPAEINPFIELQPGKKSCPPEAWAAGNPLFQRSGKLLGAALRGDIQKSRDISATDAEVKRRVCNLLQVRDTARAGDGFVVYSPTIDQLLTALAGASTSGPEPDSLPGWRFVSDRPESILDLTNGGAAAIQLRDVGAVPYQYISLKRTA